MDSDRLIPKKVCLLGAPAVGKTTLVKGFAEDVYGDKYLDSVGVNVYKRVVGVGKSRMVMLLWDIKAPDDSQPLSTPYLRGASGIMLVVDGTRRRTLEAALDLRRRINECVSPPPSIVLMLNKYDLSSQWEVHESDIENLVAQEIPVVRGSAKTGNGVEESFLTLAAQMLDR